MSLSSVIKARARELGLDWVGIAPAVTPGGVAHLRRWLERGYAGEMEYMHRQGEARAHPGSVLEGVRSVIMVAINYNPLPASPAAKAERGGPASGAASLPPDPSGLVGRVSRYAWGRDYHLVLRERLGQLLASIRDLAPNCRGRAVVDTAPLLERDFARLAGLGWIGKNTMLINKRLGSWLFLGAVLVDVELECDEPHSGDHCGTCTRCLDACPTGAFVGPYQLDSRRCISYLTIELKTQIPEDLRSLMGDWVFGCDVCQEVCPWNRKAPVSREPEFVARPDLDPPELVRLLRMGDPEFRESFRDSPLARPKRRGMARNAAVALGNSRDPAAVPALTEALDDPEPVVRGAAAWALGEIATPDATAALERAAASESDLDVQEEIARALPPQREPPGRGVREKNSFTTGCSQGTRISE